METFKKLISLKDALVIKNVQGEVERISLTIRKALSEFHRKGLVIGISGGIDSSVSLALAVQAVGKENVTGIIMPEKDSSDDSKILALELAEKFGIKTIEENITAALDGFGCYQRRDEAVSSIFPEYNPDTYSMKIGIKSNSLGQNLPPLFVLTIFDQDGVSQSKTLPPKEFLQIVGASNFKQRCRMSYLYYHAERMYCAVIGTHNKQEIEQGFFVKHGDIGSDVSPIAHLYKTQVYQLAEYLGVPKSIIERVPTSDTYSADQTQEEFFFQMPFYEMDMIWYGYENNLSPEYVAEELGKSTKEIELVYKNFTRKRKTTDYLRSETIKVV